MKRLHSVPMAMLALFAFVSPALSGHVRTPWNHTETTNRFKVLSDFNNQAVLDTETGLVWERSPDTIAQEWLIAHQTCNANIVGNRKGWRLPTIQELASLVDPNQANPALPPNHPFLNVQLAPPYWSATTLAFYTNFAWNVQFDTGTLGNANKPAAALFAWCVRGGQGVDPQ